MYKLMNEGNLHKTDSSLEEKVENSDTAKGVLIGAGVIAGTVGLSFLTSALFGYIGKWLGFGLGWLCDINPLNKYVVEFTSNNIREVAADIGGATGAIAGGILPYYLLISALAGSSD